MKSIILVLHAFRDLFIRWLPNFHKKEYAFAFLVHPRNILDVYRKYPLAKYLPENILIFVLRRFWPVILAETEGLKDKAGNPVRGWIITLPLTAEQMLEDRILAGKKILDGVKLAEKMGSAIIGLGAFTSSLTDGGNSIMSSAKISVTNGNALTAGVTVSAIEKIIKDLRKKNPRKRINLAIVGATGSIGSAVAQILALKMKSGSLVLIGRTPENIEKLKNEIKEIGSAAKITIGVELKDIVKCDIVVVSTSAKGAVIQPEHLKKNAIVYDISQPKNTSEKIKNERPDVKFIDGGLVKTPEINYHFNFGIPKETAFACLAETMILAAERIDGHFSLGKVGPEKIKKITALAAKYNFYPYDF